MSKTKKLICKQCGKEIIRTTNDLASARTKGTLNVFCSLACAGIYNSNKQKVVCCHCGKEFEKTPSQIKKSKSGNVFCSRSCSGTYNNLNKKHGTRRSKLENWLEQELLKIYPMVKFKFNSKDEINSELDIYIPELKLAFELNGIFHYEPIHGDKKLEQTQNNDKNKFKACIQKNISLCIIDTSKQKYFKSKTSKIFLSIICNIINSNITPQ